MFKKVHTYLHKVTPERPEVLQEMEGYAKKHGFPIIGPLVGRVLFQLATAIRAKRVFEMGSGYGYSAYWFSLAMGKRGEIIMTDGDKENRKRAMDYLKRANLKSSFDFRVGNALNIIKRQEGPFDIILNDIDKQDYPRTIDLAADRLRKGGLFITDNVIWNGEVADKKQSKTTQSIVEFNERLYADDRFFTTILPLRDGVAIATRK